MALDALITGLPRSGTTMTCHLLNKLPNHVALHEPLRVAQLGQLPPPEIIRKIEQFLREQRSSIHIAGLAVSKSSGGRVPSNPVADKDAGGQRRRIVDGREIHVTNVTSPAFRLFIKHPSIFTALLPHLVRRFECFASVRNPLSVLLSWRTAGLSVTQGRIPAAEQVDAELRARLAVEADVTSRHFILLDYFFRRYADYLPDRVVKYEDTIASGGRALSVLTPDASGLSETLSSRNALSLGEFPDIQAVTERLCESDNACWLFYRREDVMALLDSVRLQVGV